MFGVAGDKAIGAGIVVGIEVGMVYVQIVVHGIVPVCLALHCLDAEGVGRDEKALSFALGKTMLLPVMLPVIL